MRWTIVLLAGMLLAGAGWAQDSGEQPRPSRARMPSLEQLLGLEDASARDNDAGRNAVEELLADQSRVALDRTLTADEARERLAQAAELMGDSAERLMRGKDTGVQTQRLHDEILSRLDEVIASAREQENQQRSRRSSSSRQQQQQQQQQQQGQHQQQQTGDPDSAEENPSRQDGDLRPDAPAGSAAWGRLPDRVRDALIEGVSDRYSSLYERLTEAYYRKLAEDRR